MCKYSTISASYFLPLNQLLCGITTDGAARFSFESNIRDLVSYLHGSVFQEFLPKALIYSKTTLHIFTQNDP
jgi:hypothetical protein